MSYREEDIQRLVRRVRRRQCNIAGFHAAILYYCVEPHCFPEPQRALVMTIQIIRENAVE